MIRQALFRLSNEIVVFLVGLEARELVEQIRDAGDFPADFLLVIGVGVVVGILKNILERIQQVLYCWTLVRMVVEVLEINIEPRVGLLKTLFDRRRVWAGIDPLGPSECRRRTGLPHRFSFDTS